MLLYQVPLWYPHAHNLRIAHTHACTIIIESNISILFKRIQLDFKYKKLIWLLLYMVFSRVTASKTNIKFIKVVCLIKNEKMRYEIMTLCIAYLPPTPRDFSTFLIPQSASNNSSSSLMTSINLSLTICKNL